MISLYDYIKKDWSVAGSRSSKLIIFDLDDTIISTTAEINVIKNNKVIKTISNRAFNTYVLQKGESFDFSQFNDPDKLFKEEFTKYWNTLKREYQRGTHICIITARNDASMIREFFLKNGIDIKQELVFAVGSPDFMYTGTIAQKKAQVIKLLNNLGYTTMIFFDDNEENLKAAKKLENKNLKIYTRKV